MAWFRSLGLSTKIIAAVLTILVAVIAVNYVVFMTGYRRDTQAALMDKAAAFTAVADEAKKHASRLMSAGAVDKDALVAEAVADVAKGKSYAETRFFQAIPIVVGWTTAQNAAKEEHIEFHVAAFHARNKKNLPEPGSFRESLLRDLETQHKAGGASSLGRVDPKTNQLHYMRAIKLDETCMACHGDPQKYGVKLADGTRSTKDPLGFTMENWDVGDTHGAYEVVMPLAAMDHQIAGFFQSGMMVTVPALLIACGALLYVLRQLLTRPVGRVVAMLKDIAEGEGDLTKRLAIQRADEIGQLGKWFDTFMERLQGVIRDVAGATGDVAAASTEIAASSEEMNASVSEVARQCAKAAENAQQSGKTAAEGGSLVKQTVDGMQGINAAVTESSQSVTALGQRGQQIGAVIAVINDIADQTNLLALNAAIEAARAGEHGRGFAVVADEVRKLAERTTKATEEISGSITSIQQETTRAVERMTKGTQQVQRGVELACVAGESLEQIVAGANEVSGMIQNISAAAEQAGAGSQQSAAAASQLSVKAEQLRGLVGRFKVETSEIRGGKRNE
jgi:methyl-accepting chemotaxis protein